MQIYRFSPIDSDAALHDAVSYVAKTCAKLYFRDTGEMENDLIQSLTIFSHYQDEYEKLKTMMQKLGVLYNENNGPRFKLKTALELPLITVEVNGENRTYTTHVKYVRIRQPDPYRMQVGCCDYEDSFESQNYWLATADPQMDRSPRLIERKDYSMLEFFAPDLDVLGYVVEA